MAEEQTGVKISLLPAASAPGDNDLIPGVQGNRTVRYYLSALKTYIQSGITAAGIGAVPDTRTVNGKALSANISLDADDVGAATAPQVGSIVLSGTWTGSASPYSQTVTVTGATVTANSKVDIQLTAAQIASLIAAGVTGMVIENNNGTLTAWAVGATPSAAMTVQCTVEETI